MSAGHDVAALEQDDVAGHERGRRDDAHGAVAAHAGGRRGGVAERLEGPLAAVLGHDVRAHDRHEADEDQEPVAHLAQQDRERARRAEQQDERLGERLEQHPPDGLALGGLDGVRAGGRGPARDLVGRQADRGVHAEPGGDRDGVEGVGLRGHATIVRSAGGHPAP